MPSYSSSSQNTRVFAPYAIITQDTSRLFIKIKNDPSNVGYAVQSGITLGDVIRFNPLYAVTGVTGMYTKSQADSDANAEVLGVVESISNNNYTVVTHGSVAYPASRLVGLCGACGGVDILFLSSAVAGGLTGTIDMSVAGSRIIKPVLQMAPHGAFNAVVVNYIGFRAGSDDSVIESGGEESAFMPTEPTIGTVEWKLPNDVLDSDANWLSVKEDTEILVEGNEHIFNLYGTLYGPWVEEVRYDFGNSYAQINIGDRFYQRISGEKIGYVSYLQSQVSTGVVRLRRTAKTIQFTVNNSATITNQYDNTFRFALIRSSSVYSFTVPKVVNPIDTTQGGIVLEPYIRVGNAYEFTNTSTSNNSIVTMQNVVINEKLSVGDITDVESTLNYLQQQINQISGRF